MSPVGAIFVPFSLKTGTNMLHPPPPPIVELVARLTSIMLSHSVSASTPVSSITCPDAHERLTLSKSSVVPELVQVVIRAPSTYTSMVLVRVVPWCIADIKGRTYSHLIVLFFDGEPHKDLSGAGGGDARR